jgi:hypothetical protein
VRPTIHVAAYIGYARMSCGWSCEGIARSGESGLMRFRTLISRYRKLRVEDRQIGASAERGTIVRELTVTTKNIRKVINSPGEKGCCRIYR